MRGPPTRGLVLLAVALAAPCGALPGRPAEPGELPTPTPPGATVQGLLQPGGPPRIVAHRGLSGRTPENTLVAVRAAIDSGADMVEVDVRATADLHLVCLHDDRVDRTTDGRGALHRLSLDRVRQLDAGSWLSPVFAGEKVPTLAEVLDTARGKACLDLELKVDGERGAAVAAAAIELVHRGGMADRVLLSSSQPDLLRTIRRLHPHLATATLFSPHRHGHRDPVEVVESAGSRALIITADRVTARTVDSCHARGISVGVYVVNTPRALRRVVSLGADLIFTDRADRMTRLLARQ